METMEIILLIVGITVFIASFLLPDGKDEEKLDEEIAKEEIQNIVAAQMSEIKTQVDDTVEEAVNYAMEKTERSLERISNEKIMAVSEYSDTVLSEINKNHQEVMFLYDMLNDKHNNLKNTASAVEKTAKEAEAIAKEAKAVSKVAEEATKKAEKVFPAFHSLQPEKVVPIAEEIDEKGMSKQAEVNEVNFNNNETILALHKLGKTKVEIAKELGLGVGEVSLVIDLFKG